MSYREENGQIVLTMSREDYDVVLLRLGMAAGLAMSRYGAEHLNRHLATLNRLNEGNPNYTPYALPTDKPP